MVSWRIAIGLVSFTAAASLAAQVQVRDDARPATGTARLAGRVLTAGEGAAPVRGATVMLADVTGRIPSRAAETDEQGRFAFVDLPAGRYELGATKPAYLRAGYGATRPMRPSTPIALSADQQLTTLTLTMWRGGVITGMLFDEKNVPLGGVTVSVRRLQIINGKRTIAAATTGTATTDNRGLYRIFGLPPGDYAALSTITGPGRSGPSQTTAARQTTVEDVQRALRNDPRTGRGTSSISPEPMPPVLGYAPVFYPGTTIAVDATPVHVDPGEERNGVDFSAQLVPLSEVSGTIATSDGRPLTDLQVNVELIARSAPSGLVLSRPVTVATNGTFTIGSVTPGQYGLMARATLRPTVSGDPGPAIGWWAAATVLIDGRSLSGVFLTLEPGVTVTGRIVFDGASPPSLTAVGVSVRLLPVRNGHDVIDDGRFAVATPHGAFAFAGVAPGDYLLAASINPRGATLTGWTFKSATVGSRDITDLPLTISSGTALDDVVVTFTNRLTEISGTVQDATGKPSSEYFIVAIPVNRALWSAGARRVQVVRPGTDGQYGITGLPSGDYALVGIADVEPDDLLVPAFLERLLAVSTVRVSLKEGAKLTQDIRVAGSASHP